ncbi:hypothetical protein NDU88_002122 [Pleurodeles waltl]|uniref:Uncharacterized protein n=1 Tax=Pleurodeles waltl TaxID=8319 RepID=A0AAV7M351_PLEWA|nr:hypothetical protein NDU88_002122 [Pleurodeles waltl]
MPSPSSYVLASIRGTHRGGSWRGPGTPAQGRPKGVSVKVRMYLCTLAIGGPLPRRQPSDLSLQLDGMLQFSASAWGRPQATTKCARATAYRLHPSPSLRRQFIDHGGQEGSRPMPRQRRRAGSVPAAQSASSG